MGNNNALLGDHSAYNVRIYVLFLGLSDYFLATENKKGQRKTSRCTTLIFKPPVIQKASNSSTHCTNHYLTLVVTKAIYIQTSNFIKSGTRIPFTFLRKYLILVSPSTTKVSQAVYWLRICIQKFLGLYRLQ